MKKLLLASALALTTSVAVADPIYLDIGADFGGNDNFVVDTNTTGWLDQLLHTYQSITTVVDLDKSFDGSASSLLTDGDSITTNGGFIDGDLSSLSTNYITGLNPGQGFTGPSSNGFNPDFTWGLSFQITDLVGTINGDGAAQYLDYTSGAISFFYYELSMGSTADFIELFTIDVTGSGLTASGSFIKGSLSDFGTDYVNGVDGVVGGNLFNTALGGFKEYSEAQASSELSVHSLIDYNTEDLKDDDITFLGLTGEKQAIVRLNGQHDGSIAFNVPEPTSLAILGLGLLGFAASSRKKSA